MSLLRGYCDFTSLSWEQFVPQKWPAHHGFLEAHLGDSSPGVSRISALVMLWVTDWLTQKKQRVSAPRKKREFLTALEARYCVSSKQKSSTFALIKHNDSLNTGSLFLWIQLIAYAGIHQTWSASFWHLRAKENYTNMLMSVLAMPYIITILNLWTCKSYIFYQYPQYTNRLVGFLNILQSLRTSHFLQTCFTNRLVLCPTLWFIVFVIWVK